MKLSSNGADWVVDGSTQTCPCLWPWAESQRKGRGHKNLWQREWHCASTEDSKGAKSCFKEGLSISHAQKWHNGISRVHCSLIKWWKVGSGGFSLPLSWESNSVVWVWFPVHWCCEDGNRWLSVQFFIPDAIFGWREHCFECWKRKLLCPQLQSTMVIMRKVSLCSCSNDVPVCFIFNFEDTSHATSAMPCSCVQCTPTHSFAMASKSLIRGMHWLAHDMWVWTLIMPIICCSSHLQPGCHFCLHLKQRDCSLILFLSIWWTPAALFAWSVLTSFFDFTMLLHMGWLVHPANTCRASLAVAGHKALPSMWSLSKLQSSGLNHSLLLPQTQQWAFDGDTY